MKNYNCVFGRLDPAQTKKFLSMSKNAETEKKIILNRHILSRYFRAVPFAVFDESGEIVCRLILALYPDEDKAYLGFFESLDDSAACKILFTAAENYAKKHGIKKILGPYNCSFWLGCRMKLDNFDDTYTGEPLNPPHYPRLWQENGYTICEKYHSNIYKKPEGHNEKCRQRLKYFKNNGYIFKTMTKRGFKRQLSELYALLTRLYSTFPEYRHITEDDFIRLYSPLKNMLCLKKTALVYKDGKLAAFMIPFPDYSKTKGLFGFYKTQKDPERLIFMYLGADPGHRGLGSALAETMRNMQEGKTSVGALIHGQKPRYYSELIENTYNYALLCKNI